MEKVVIYGPSKLQGEVAVSGSKNSLSAVLPAMCLMGEGAICKVENIPDIEDVKSLCGILRELGLQIKHNHKAKRLQVSGKIVNTYLTDKYVSKIRASSLFLGALVSACGRAHVPFCGGDNIGDRPLDIHVYVLEKFKVKVDIREGAMDCVATEYPLKGTTIFLRYPSVGATQNALLLAVKATGDTYIYNAACEPEVTDLAVALNSMGARISGAGTNVIHVSGVKNLGDMKHELIPDRLECATYLLAFAMTHGRGKISGVIPEHCMALISLLKDIGVQINQEENCLEIDATCESYKPMQIDALPYPGLPTDVQPMVATLAAACTGNSIIRDTVFTERFQYVSEYQKMGVEVNKSYNQIYVTGPQMFKPATVRGGDIRTAVSLLLAALTADGKTVLDGYEHIKRAYEYFDVKMNALGARIEEEV